jgi:hypothetical protein
LLGMVRRVTVNPWRVVQNHLAAVAYWLAKNNQP